MSPPQRLLLVDSHSLIYRAFFALPALTDRKGRLTNAAFGFTSMLLNALPGMDLVAAAFDHPSKTFRHDEYAEYKAQRPKAPDDLVSQFPIVREVVEALNFAVYTKEGFEADDIIGTLATQADTMGLKTSILTGDLDVLQLVTPNVEALTTRRGISDLIRYGVDEVRARYGLEPAQVPDLKALKGDNTDNIPGVPGVGDKTASKLLQDYGSIEGILEHLHEMPPGRVTDALREHAEQLPLSKRLATIIRDVDVNLDPEESRLKDYDDAAVRELFEEYDFRTLMPRLPRPVGSNKKKPEDREGTGRLPDGDGDGVQAAASVAGPARGAQVEFAFATPATTGGKAKPLEVPVEVVDTPARLKKLLKEWAPAPAVSLVLDDPQPRHSALAGIALAPAAGDKAAYLALRAGGAEAGPAQQLLGALRDAWAGLDLTAYSLKQVELAMGPRDFPPPHGFDVSLASYLCDSRAKTPPVAELSYQWLGRTLQPVSDVLGSGKKALLPGDVDVETAARLFGPEPAALALLKAHLDPELERQHVAGLYRDVEVPLAPILAEMELAGVGVDTRVLDKLSTELTARIKALEDEIQAVAGHEININSPIQLQKLLFEELGLSPGRRTTTGKVSTDSTVLEKLRDAHPVVDLVLEYRQLTKLKSTYIDALPGLVDPADGRIHTSFNQTVAATGRLSSSDPNLQNIPIRTEMGRRIRQAFVPRKGNVLLGADYSQIELRILAHLCGDPALVQAFAEGQDIHAVTASAVFNIPLEEVTPDQRRAAKVANFGVLYGLSAGGLQRDLGMPIDEARDFIDRYFKRFARVRAYLDEIKKAAYLNGYVETLLGRRRYLQDLRAANPVLRSAAERMAINMPFQGSNADIMKLAMVAIRRRMGEDKMRSQMVLQVHDELVFDADKAEVDHLGRLVKEEMTGAYQLRVPLAVEVKVGPDWSRVEPLEVEAAPAGAT
jgi:DNA polymerase-1